jgi:general nucleoside transport system permease protein
LSLLRLSSPPPPPLQYLLQSLGLDLPYQLFLALPYLLTLAVLAGVAGRVQAPRALGRAEII